MKNIILIFGLIIGLNAFAASGSGQVSNILSFGGMDTGENLTIGDLNSQGYFTLYTTSNHTSGDEFNPFIKNGVVYQVTNGKTFKVNKICFENSNTVVKMQLVSATSTFAAQAGSLTGGVYQAGAAAAYTLLSAIATNGMTCFDMFYDFAQNTYPGIQLSTNGRGMILVVGKEI